MQNSCPNCKTPVGAPDWKARSTILWANQHGDKRRIFCDVCGQWSDVTYTDKALGELVRVVKEPVSPHMSGQEGDGGVWSKNNLT